MIDQIIFLLVCPLIFLLIFSLNRKPLGGALSQFSALLALPVRTQPRYPTGTC